MLAANYRLAPPVLEVRIRVPFLFSVVYFSRGSLPPKRAKAITGGPSRDPSIN